ncbi:protein tyrosine phosphatase [Paenibacillus sophorae]|nr:protein tyrosine phosphatase [Paenibacillus sophorae]
MIDIHSHILPFADDGASGWEDALAMARDAHEDGIQTVIATPHHANGQYLNPADNIMDGVAKMNEKLCLEGIPLTVLPGQEIRVYANLLDDLERGVLLPLASSRYMLLEMPSSRVPSRMEELCHELIIQGYVPVIAHPERNAEIAAHPERLERLVGLGAVGQLTAQSLTGEFGGKLQKLSLELCRRNTIHVLASDAHNGDSRPFGLYRAYQMIDKQLGGEIAGYFRKNAQNIVSNIPIEQRIVESSGKKRHNFFGLFRKKD